MVDIVITFDITFLPDAVMYLHLDSGVIDSKLSADFGCPSENEFRIFITNYVSTHCRFAYRK